MSVPQSPSEFSLFTSASSLADLMCRRSSDAKLSVALRASPLAFCTSAFTFPRVAGFRAKRVLLWFALCYLKGSASVPSGLETGFRCMSCCLRTLLETGIRSMACCPRAFGNRARHRLAGLTLIRIDPAFMGTLVLGEIGTLYRSVLQHCLYSLDNGFGA